MPKYRVRLVRTYMHGTSVIVYAKDTDEAEAKGLWMIDNLSMDIIGVDEATPDYADAVEIEPDLKPIKDREKIEETIYHATASACEVLDQIFPGFEEGGIDSNMMGELEQFIYKELRKRKLIPEDL